MAHQPATKNTTQARDQRRRNGAGDEIRRLRTELRASQALAKMLQRENEALRADLRDLLP